MRMLMAAGVIAAVLGAARADDKPTKAPTHAGLERLKALAGT